MTGIYVATEDPLSEAVVARLVSEVAPNLRIDVKIGRQGNGYLKRKLPELIVLAEHVPVVIVTDLDRGACAPLLVGSWIPTNYVIPDKLIFRVAIREVEAWLLADRIGFSDFSGVPINRIPVNPETIPNPKEILVSLVRRHGKRSIRSEIVPQTNSQATVAVGYNNALAFFAENAWSLENAKPCAESLMRACNRLQELDRRCEV